MCEGCSLYPAWEWSAGVDGSPVCQRNMSHVTQVGQAYVCVCCRRAGLQERCKYVMASDAIAEEQQLQVEMEGLDDEVRVAACCTRACVFFHSPARALMVGLAA